MVPSTSSTSILEMVTTTAIIILSLDQILDPFEVFQLYKLEYPMENTKGLFNAKAM